MQRIGDLGRGEAIVRLATGEQKLVQFHHCQSEHVSHSPTAQAAINRYASMSFTPDASYGAYIEDEEMEVEQAPTQPVVVPYQPTVREQIAALVASEPELRKCEIAKRLGCHPSTVSHWFRRHTKQISR